MTDKRIILGIGLPHYGLRSVTWQAEQWITFGFALANAHERFNLRLIDVVDVCGVEVARNQLMHDALKQNVNWLLMVDTDTWHADGFDIVQMISSADRQGYAVVAVPTPRRGADDTHLMVYRGEERRPLTPEDLAVEADFVEIDSAATSMMAINVDFVKEHMAPPWFRFEWKYGSLDFGPEDLSFCRRIREAKGKIGATTKFVARHLQRPTVL